MDAKSQLVRFAMPAAGWLTAVSMLINAGAYFWTHMAEIKSSTEELSRVEIRMTDLEHNYTQTRLDLAIMSGKMDALLAQQSRNTVPVYFRSAIPTKRVGDQSIASLR